MSFITYDRSVHFYSLPEGASQPTQLTVCDVDDVFLPSPTDILVNLQENNGLVRQLLEALPEMFANSYITESALGAALQVGRSQLPLQTYVSKPLQIESEIPLPRVIIYSISRVGCSEIGISNWWENYRISAYFAYIRTWRVK